jgi:hypothetical protein
MSFRGLRSGVRPKIGQKTSQREVEGILDGPISMVRLDQRRDKADVPEISSPQERERDVEHPEGTSSPQGVHSP